ncbi:MAG: class F sortase [Pseudonocardia sp.]
MSRRWMALVVPVVMVTALVGCSKQEDSAGPNDGPTLSAPSIVGGPVAPIPSLEAANPVDLKIDAINASSTLVPLGLNPDQTIATPPVSQPLQASWYKLGPTPGAVGPAVILGHINGNGQQGIFSRLHELKPGDQVKVSRADGKTAIFTVTKLEQVAKDTFPTLAVYGDTQDAELRLITCGGSFDRSRRSYLDNIIVYAAFTDVV